MSTITYRVYRLHADLRGVEPAVWRRIMVPAELTLDDLHVVLQMAFAWDDRRPYEFEVGGQCYVLSGRRRGTRDSQNAVLGEILPGQGGTFRYTYSGGTPYGDVDIHVEEVESREQLMQHPLVVAGKGATPMRNKAGDEHRVRISRTAVNRQLGELFELVIEETPDDTHPYDTESVATAVLSRLSTSPDDQVIRLVILSLQRQQAAPEWLILADKMWWRYVDAMEPNIRKAERYAAALEYYLSRVGGFGLSQSEVARPYGIAAASLSQVYTQMREFLGEPEEWAAALSSTKRRERTAESEELAQQHLLSEILDESAEPGARPRLKPKMHQSIASLPVVPDHEVLVGIRPLHHIRPPDQREGWPGMVELVMVYDPKADAFRSEFVVYGGRGERFGLAVLPQAFSMPRSGVAMIPGRIIVESKRLAEWIDAELSRYDVEVVVVDKPLPILDAAAKRLIPPAEEGPWDEESDGEDEDDDEGSYLRDGVTPEHMRPLFEAAAELAEAAPWHYLYDHEVLEIEWQQPDGSRRNVCISIMGALGEFAGFSVLPSWEAARHLREVAKHGGFLTDIHAATLGYDTSDEVFPQQAREVREHNWPLHGPDWYPMFITLNTSQLAKSRADLMLLLAHCAHAIAAFTMVFQAELRARAWTEAPLELMVEAWADAPMMRVWLPHSEGLLSEGDDTESR